MGLSLENWLTWFVNTFRVLIESPNNHSPLLMLRKSSKDYNDCSQLSNKSHVMKIENIIFKYFFFYYTIEQLINTINSTIQMKWI